MTQNTAIPYRDSKEIRQSFIDFFVKRSHVFVPSDSIAPKDDPTLLFTNSGMNQFKAFFLSDDETPYKRAANSQKCLRVSGKHNDLDEVGRDGTHHTFFEMLGNWSFGDYYKKEAITWAWELLTAVWQIPKNRLFVTVYQDDDEAFELWKTLTDIEPHRIMRFGAKENFWEMGPVGPCGPCTEIHFDKGDLNTQNATYADPKAGVNGQNERYVEIWNLVFMQNERMLDGSLRQLKAKHVDTGSGLERICSVIQNKSSNYDTDLFAPIIKEIEKRTNISYSQGEDGVPHRVIADHIRALSFAIADGITPSHEGKGYVIRRILRRASRFAHRLGQKKPFLYSLVATLADIMGDAYPSLIERKTHIEEMIKSEEARFLKTLDAGLTRLSKVMEQIKTQKKNEISGEDVFLFHDTYGFPSDLTEQIARENKLHIDHAGFQSLMAEQKERGRKAAKFDHSLLADDWTELSTKNTETVFTGYQSLEENSSVIKYKEVGDYVFVVLNKTPFYAESGGQVGDQGLLTNDQISLDVLDTFIVLGSHVHKCMLKKGFISAQNMVQLHASVDKEKRTRTRVHHSATHLLHASLRLRLGTHVEQQGSSVDPYRLRFDFCHAQALSEQEIFDIEKFVNDEILKNNSIQTNIMSQDDAKASGALALFGEKYDEKVRVLSMGQFSKELCGGTHAQATGEIGIFRIISESAISSGVRRIEALAGQAAIEYIEKERAILKALSKVYKSPSEHLIEKATETFDRVKKLEQKLKEKNETIVAQYIKTLWTTSKNVGENKLVVHSLKEGLVEANELNSFTDQLSASMPEKTIAVITSKDATDLSIIVCVSKDLIKTLPAGEIVKELAEIANGRGGGRPEKARAGSKHPEKESSVHQHAFAIIQKKF